MKLSLAEIITHCGISDAIGLQQLDKHIRRYLERAGKKAQKRRTRASWGKLLEDHCGIELREVSFNESLHQTGLGAYGSEVTLEVSLDQGNGEVSEDGEAGRHLRECADGPGEGSDGASFGAADSAVQATEDPGVDSD